MRVHGGPDAFGRAAVDLSTGSLPGGPLSLALARVQAADPAHYPDPSHLGLKALLAQRHGVAPERVLIAASASEFIQRITAVSARLAPGPVALPARAYGDYAAAAAAWGRPLGPQGATLRWCAEPGSPDGASTPPPADLQQLPTVLDLAYAPLRLDEQPGWPADALAQVFQLWTPNKALGLCGVRGAYAIAPRQAPPGWCEALQAAEPSWPLGAHGLALLESWCEPGVQQQLAERLQRLRVWREALCEGLQARGFQALPGVAPFVALRCPTGAPDAQALRWQGVAVRELSSFGLPGHWRVNSGPPEQLAALWKALDA